jgi:hypothetical protein
LIAEVEVAFEQDAHGIAQGAIRRNNEDRRDGRRESRLRGREWRFRKRDDGWRRVTVRAR